MGRGLIRKRFGLTYILAAVLISGCSISFSHSTNTQSVPRDHIEARIAQRLKDSEGGGGSVHCDGDLDAKVDATQHCNFTTPGGSRRDVIVKVTKVDGTKVDYDIDVQPAVVSTDDMEKADLESSIKASVEKQNVTVKSVTCDGPLSFSVGSTQHCTVIDTHGDGIAILVTATNGANGSNYHWEVIDHFSVSPSPTP